VAVVAAGRGRLVWAVYGHHDGAWRPTTASRNGTVSELATHARGLTDGAIVAGELTPEQEATMRTIPQAIVPPHPLRGRRPAALADLAWHRFRAGETDEPATLEPVYVHAPATPS
jgi:tRNA threonylcarbamoyladenosine biosynthesis protein TsaB